MEASRRCCKRLKELGSRVLLAWVPSYIGVKGNEVADTLVKLGTQEESTRKIKVTYTDLKETYKNQSRSRIMKQSMGENV